MASRHRFGLTCGLLTCPSACSVARPSGRAGTLTRPWGRSTSLHPVGGFSLHRPPVSHRSTPVAAGTPLLAGPLLPNNSGSGCRKDSLPREVHHDACRGTTQDENSNSPLEGGRAAGSGDVSVGRFVRQFSKRGTLCRLPP